MANYVRDSPGSPSYLPPHKTTSPKHPSLFSAEHVIDIIKLFGRFVENILKIQKRAQDLKGLTLGWSPMESLQT